MKPHGMTFSAFTAPLRRMALKWMKLIFPLLIIVALIFFHVQSSPDHYVYPTVSMKKIIDWSEMFSIVYKKRNFNEGNTLLMTNLSYYGYMPPWIPQCEDIYLDLGSNIGVTVRKLFEPENYPECKIKDLFSETFNHLQRTGSKAGLCAFGFEPNPKHFKRLKGIEANYTKKGWNVHFFPLAISDKNENITFYSEDNSSDNNDWGTSLFENHNVKQTGYTVKSIRLAEFIFTVLKGKSVKLGKMDLEGAEYKVLVDLLENGLLCQNYIKSVFVEFHPYLPPDLKITRLPAVEMVEQINAQMCHVTHVFEFDDETYLLDNDEK